LPIKQNDVAAPDASITKNPLHKHFFLKKQPVLRKSESFLAHYGQYCAVCADRKTAGNISFAREHHIALSTRAISP
jgi:hypothetical protein